MAVSVKILGEGAVAGGRFPLGQVVFSRSFFALIPVLIWIMLRSGLREAVATRNPFGHIRRSTVGILGMFSGFAGLLVLPLADATVISYAAPLVTVMLAALILKERVRVFRWTAIAIGFVGVVIAMAPHLSIFSGAAGQFSGRGALLSLAGAVFAAFAMIEVRRLTATETTAAIVFYFSAFSTLIGLITLPLGWYYPAWAWVMPHGWEMLTLVMIGIFGGLGQITLTSAYRLADTSVVAPFDYLNMIWAVAAGYALFGQLPDQAVVIGSAIIMLAGLFVIFRESQLGLERKRQLEAGPARSV